MVLTCIADIFKIDNQWGPTESQAGNSAQYSLIFYMGKEFEKE